MAKKRKSTKASIVNRAVKGFQKIATKAQEINEFYRMISREKNPRRHIQRTRPTTWLRRGFLTVEAYFLSEVSGAGAKSPLIQTIIRQRRSLNANRARYKWTPQEYEKRVERLFIRYGVRARNPRETMAHYLYKTFYEYLNAVKADENFEETPRPKSRRKSTPSQKQIKLRSTKKQAIRKKIDIKNDEIRKAMRYGDQKLREKLEKERNRLQNQHDKLDDMR